MSGIKPKLYYSDVHFHNWSAFSTVEDGINTRLLAALQELRRAYEDLRERGGNVAFCAGDLFHVRGLVATSVLVPVLNFYAELKELGFVTYCLAGNHDLETNDTTWAGSLVSALKEVGVHPIDAVKWVEDACFVPWHASVADLKAELEKLASDDLARHTDLIIHAPVNGVIKGIPDHGLEPEWLAKLGFRRVFAGHYHNHVEFGGGIYSVGALTHQTWGDVGSKAGYLIVDDKTVTRVPTQAPRFVDLDQMTVETDEDLLEAVSGNYVRCSIDNPTQEVMNERRKELHALGAEGVLIRAINTTSVTPTAARTTKAKLDSLDESVVNYAEKKGGPDLVEACRDVLNTVRSAKAA